MPISSSIRGTTIPAAINMPINTPTGRTWKNVQEVVDYANSLSPVSSFKNKLINGNFDIWQRGTSQTSTGYGSDDRWSNNNSGTTKTHSRQLFLLGQTDVPGNPKYFSRTVVTSVAGASNYCLKKQRIEAVSTFAGKTATLSFYAKADAVKQIAVELEQGFGTGGSPSAAVTGIGLQKINLTTSWQKFTVTINVSSISGKTLGTDNSDALDVYFWFDAGSTYNSRTNTLGQQSGTFDIAQVQLEEGSTATPFEQRPLGIELMLCQRYYEKSYDWDVVPGTISTPGRSAIYIPFSSTSIVAGSQFSSTFKVNKRAYSTVVMYNPSSTTPNRIGTTSGADRTCTLIAIGQSGFNFSYIDTATDGIWWHWMADAEL